jgi:hypothetical protein
MKKGLLKFALIFLLLFCFASFSLAEEDDDFIPSKNEEYIGKKITFRNALASSADMLIIGTQYYYGSMEESYFFHVPCGSYFFGQKIKEIIFTNDAVSRRWVINLEDSQGKTGNYAHI